MSDLDDAITETRLPDIIQTGEYQNILDLLTNENTLTYNFALSETIRLMENLSGRPETDRRVMDFASKAAKYLSDYRLSIYHDSTIAELELLLHAMSSVLHVLSANSTLVIQAEIRSSIYKSVSNFWATYRKAKFMDGSSHANIINANIIFRLREIRNCLCSRIKDDQSGANAALQRGGNALEIVLNVLQKEYFAAFGSFIKILDFEYATGDWYYEWEEKREKYFVLLQQYSENAPEISNFYRELYKLSSKEFDRVLRKNTKYRNFEYKVLKSGGVITGSSLPDNIDTLLIGYLHLIQQLLEEERFLPQIDKKYIRKTINLCNKMVDVHVKKQITFKALEVLFVIRNISEKNNISDNENNIINEINLNIDKWYNTIPTPAPRPLRSLSSPAYLNPRPLSSPAYLTSRPLSYVPSSQYDIPFTTSPTSSKFPLQIDMPMPTPTSARTSISTVPPSPYNPLPTPSVSRKEKRQKRLSLNNVREIPTKVTTSLSSFQIRYPRKRIIDNVNKLFKERSAIIKEIKEINAIKEKYDKLEKDESIDTNSLLLKFKEMLDESENKFSKIAVKYIDREISSKNTDNPPQIKKDDNIDNDSFFLKIKEMLRENMLEIRNNETKIDNPQKEDIDDNRKGVEGSVSGSESDIHDEINNDGIDNNKGGIVDNKVETVVKKVETVVNKVKIVNNKVEIVDDKVKIVDNKVEIVDDKVEIVDNKAETVVKKVETVVNKIKIVNNKVEIVDDKVKIVDNKVEIVDDKVEIVDNKVEIVEDKVDIVDDKVEIVKDNKVEIVEDKVDIVDDKVEIVDDKDGIVDEKDGIVEMTTNVDDPQSEEKEESKEVEDSHDVKSPESIPYEETNNNEVEINTNAEPIPCEETEEIHNTEAEINTNEVANSHEVVENNNLEVEKGREIEIESDNVKQDEEIPAIIVSDNDEQIETNPHLNNESNDPTIIKHYIINNTYTTTTTTAPNDSSLLDTESSTFLRRALKKIAELVESVEYITDQAVKGRQAALRLSNNVSSSSVNEIIENEKEVKKVEEEKEVEKVEGEKEVEKVEEEKVVEKVEEEKVVEKVVEVIEVAQ